MLIVPVAAAPPVTPFTCQVTDMLDEPLTVEVKALVAPARTFAELGETPTVIVAGGGGGGTPGLPADPLVTPEQSAWKKATRSNNSMEMRRTAVVPRG